MNGRGWVPKSFIDQKKIARPHLSCGSQLFADTHSKAHQSVIPGLLWDGRHLSYKDVPSPGFYLLVFTKAQKAFLLRKREVP